MADPPIDDFARWLIIEADYTLFDEPCTETLQIHTNPDDPEDVESELTETLRYIHSDEIMTTSDLRLTDYRYPSKIRPAS